MKRKRFERLLALAVTLVMMLPFSSIVGFAAEAEEAAVTTVYEAAAESSATSELPIVTRVLAESTSTLVSIPPVAPVDGIPYGRPVAVAAGPNAVWTLGNFLPRQIPIITGAGETLADVNWVINTTAIPPTMYSPAVFVPQTFNVSGAVVLPDNVANTNDVSLEVTIQVTVDGGKKVDVPWTAARPDIDSGWDNATTIFVQDYIRRTVAHPGMPEDPFAPTATAEADILWGNENLYVRIRVTDDNISTSGANHTVDGAEVFLSEAGFRGAQSALQAHQMNQYRVSSTGAATFRWNSAQSAMIINEAWRRVARETDTGYEVFVAIPLLYNNGPTEGTTMLMDIMLNDATLPAGTRTAEISWNDPSWGGFSNSNGWGEITLVRDGDARHSIVATTGPNGSISPTSLAGRVWVDHGASQTFTVTPAFGFVVDTATVNGEPVTLTNNTFTFTNVTTADNNIHVTFKPAEDAVELPFIVWNDNFPAGEFTTAVIIDVGEGNEAIAAELDKANFAVAATNTRLVGGAVAFDGARNITRVYTNTEPRVLGYVGPGRNHPDPLPPTPATGRYIIVELEFWTLGGGLSTLDASNSTVQNYRVNHNGPIPLTGANPDIELMYFTQLDAGNTGVRAVNEVLDQFRPGPVMDGLPVIGGTHYIHRDENGEPVMNLPLYIYFHGGGRGTDAFSPLRSQNGAAALATRIFNGDERFASHIFAPTGGQNWANWNTVIQAMIEEGWVDPGRIYISGFSGGGNSTHAFARNLPHLPAALVPIGPARGFFTEAEVLNIPGLADVSYWVLVHRFDDGGGGGGVPGCYPGTAIFFGLYGHGTVYHFDPMTNMATWNAASHMRYARITVFRNNDTFAWPMNQWTPEQAPPYGATGWAAHESEAPVLFNTLLDMAYFNYWPNNLPGEDHPSYPDYRAELLRLAEYYDDVFDWIFAQVRVPGDRLISIPPVTPVDGIPYGRPVAAAAGPNAVWTLGNFLPSQIPLVTTDGRIMADVNWVINTTAIPPEMYSPAVFVPQTFNVSGTVVLPAGMENPNDVSLEVTVQVTVDGGQKVDVPWTAVQPDIDGGWDNATTIYVENYIRRTAAHPGMPEDPFAPTATAEADLLWGDENLYVRVRVTDDNISTVGGNHTVDGAEVFLSEAAFRGAQIGTQAHQMNQYRLSSTGIFTIRWNSAQTGIISNEAWRRVSRETDVGYDVFLAIPLLYNHGPVDGTTMLFDIMLNDATLPATTRTAEISWNDPSWGGFSNSHGWGEITLVRDGDERPSIVATSGHNGSISPATLSGRLWLEYGADQTFTFTPAFGFVVDTVLVNGAPVTVTGNTFTFTNVTEDQTIHVTFRPDAASVGIPFIVYNDIFPASGLVPFVYTTAVIIDLGEGNSVNLADISDDMFIVSATNTRLDGTTVVFDGERRITRAYVNTEPVPLGYIDPAPGSPDLVTATPAAGRYIILELAFWGPDGPILDARADDGPNSTMLNYRINVVRNLTYQVGGATQSVIPRFEQERVVAPALDRFVPDRTNPDGPGDMRILIAIHEAYQEVGPLPLFIYHHGGGRGGPAGEADRFAPLMTLNGAAVLSKMQLEHPGRFDAHLIATQAHANNQANRDALIAYVEELVEAGIVDPNRIYMSGFSMGSMTTLGFLVNNPEFLAAVIPIGGGTMPTQAQIDANPGILDVALWPQMHIRDGMGGRNWTNYFSTGIGSTGVFREANVSIFETHTMPIFPFFGWAEGAAHETEGAAFGQVMGTKDLYFAFGAHEKYADLYIFDWLFNQSRQRYDDDTLVSIPAVTAVDGIPYGRPVAVAAPPNAVWTLGNFLPRQIPIITGAGEILADVNWVINTTAIPPDMYSPARFVPQTFNVGGTVVLPDGIVNPNDVSLEVTIQVTVDGGKRVDIPWTASRPNIDGGWDNATTIFVEDYIRRAAIHPGMPDDPFAPTATAEADILWGDENLYVRIRVTDDNISTVGANHTLDGAEVFLSEAAFRGAQSGLQAHQMNQYRVASTGVFTFRWNSGQTAIIGSEEWRRVARMTDTGYEVFMAIPLLYNNGPVEGQTMLFDIMLNDATLPAGTRTAEISWNDPSWGGFSNSNGWGEITLVREGDVRHSIVATAGDNGSISPTSLAGRLWVEHGGSQTFTVTPAFGHEVDTVTVNGEVVTLVNNTFTFTNVTTADNSIHVTFRPSTDATTLDFIVFNDMFPAGEFTTAVIIDLGEGRSANLSDLDPAMFTVAARNTRLDGTTVTFNGARAISRVYVNTEPEVLGYIAPAPGSPDLVTNTPASGRYIIIELIFWGPMGGYAYGGSTVDASNSTILNYRINMSSPLPLANGQALTAVFNQEAVVSPVVDMFVADSAGNVNFTISIDESYRELGPLPVFIYFHGGGRGPDRFAPLRTANGAAMLAQMQIDNPGVYNSHIIAMQNFANNVANRNSLIEYVTALGEQGLVDMNRIYMSGFSAGSGNTYHFIRNHPYFVAAAIPIAGTGAIISEAELEARPEIAEVAIWHHVHRADNNNNVAPNLIAFFSPGGLGTSGRFENMNGTILETNRAFGFPHFGFDWTAHESEAAVFGNKIGAMDVFLSYVTHGEFADYADMHIFDWLFAQRRGREELTLTFHLYTANQTILDAFDDYVTDVVDDIPVIVVPVVPGTAATTWAGLEYVLGIGHLYGTAEGHGYAFWGWFDDKQLDESGRTGDGLRRPALTLAGESMCVLADLLDQLENATMEEAIALFDDGNIDLYGVWVRFGDVDDNGLVNMLDLQLLQRHVNFTHLLPVYFSGAAADVVIDGLVNMTDLSLLQRFTNFSHIITVVLGERPQ